MKWTEERNKVLAENASLGAEAARLAIRDETGATPSLAAVIKHASRLGISLSKVSVCPRCGGRYKELHKDGLCDLCHFRNLRDMYEIKNVKRTKSPTPELMQARREYDRLRKRKSKKNIRPDL